MTDFALDKYPVRNQAHATVNNDWRTMKGVRFPASFHSDLIPHSRFKAAGHASGIIQYD